MTHRAKRPCRHAGCPNLVDGWTYCPEHTKEKPKKHWECRVEDEYASDWPETRLQFIRRNPHCADCWAKGLIVLSAEVHHIVPRHRGGTDDPSNLMALCRACHIAKTNENVPLAASVILVRGAPYSGRLDYVLAHQRNTDIMINPRVWSSSFSRFKGNEAPEFIYDGIKMLVGRMEGVVVRTARTTLRSCSIWLVDTAPRRTDVMRWRPDEVITMDTRKEVCLSWARSSDASHREIAAIHAWYENLEALE